VQRLPDLHDQSRKQPEAQSDGRYHRRSRDRSQTLAQEPPPAQVKSSQPADQDTLQPMPMIPVVLTIAGLDPSSGAGLTADLKVIAAHGLYGVACPTVLTVQSTQGVRSTEKVAADYVADVLDCLIDDVTIAAIKIGALGSRAVLHAVTSWLQRQSADMPVVLDPVLLSSSGYSLLESDAVEAMQRDLLPLVNVITPNVAELRYLLGGSFDTRASIEHGAHSLLAQLRGVNCSVVVTGGETVDAGQNRDEQGDKDLGSGLEQQHCDDFALVSTSFGPSGLWLSGNRVTTRSTHGTGCAFSSALACGLARGIDILAAARAAKHYVERALQAAYPVGKGRGPMHHLWTSAARLPKGSRPHDG
jgi:hydroxymethylpyrimidine/phosphomethylpyrimidine kinase